MPPRVPDAPPSLPGPRTHLAWLEHPVVQAHVSLRAFGTIADPLQALAAELRRRTAPGARVLAPFSGDGRSELELARQLPDRQIIGIEPVASWLDAAHAGREGTGNVHFSAGDPDDQLAGGPFDAVVGLGSLHRSRDPSRLWSALRAALRPDGVVLAQEYVGPSELRWPERQSAAATQALDTLVPPALRRHHAAADERTAEPLRNGPAPLAPRSDELVGACVAAGFAITGIVKAGCSLLLPVLLLQSDAYEVARWDHSLVLADLCRQETRLLADGTLTDDYVMFVAEPR